MVIQIEVEQVLKIIKEEITHYEMEEIRYKEMFDCAIEFSREYWNNRDKYYQAYLRKTCLIETLNKILNEVIK